MPILTLRNNRVVNLLGGGRGFNVASNLVPNFEIGELPHEGTNRLGTTYFLKGEMVGPDEEFLFNGVLFLPDASKSGTIIDNFPKGPTPKGWTMEPLIDAEGYKLRDNKTGAIIFGYQVIENVCHVITNIYDDNGVLIAEATVNDFLIHRAPARCGGLFSIR
jgi:hypothetical protein